MCIVKSIKIHDGSFIRYCEHTGLPIIIDNELGLFCERECGAEAIVHGKRKAAEWLDDMAPIFKSKFL